jgi:hypothetical protein
MKCRKKVIERKAPSGDLERTARTEPFQEWISGLFFTACAAIEVFPLRRRSAKGRSVILRITLCSVMN